MKAHKILLVILTLLITNNIHSKTLIWSCDAGSINGERVQYTKSNGIEISKDRVTQPKIEYHIDTENKKNTKVTYGNKSRPASILFV